MTAIPYGTQKIITVNPTVTAGAYHVNDCIGGKLTLEDALISAGSQAYLLGICITDEANQKKALEVVFFRADPAVATLTDNAAIVFSTDLANVIARVPIAATDWVTVGGAGIADVQKLFLLEADEGNRLYAAIMAVEAPTFAAVTDLSVKFRLAR